MLTEPELLDRLKRVQHFLCPGQAYWLHRQSEALPDGSAILEIGCYHGCSTAAMALGLEGRPNSYIYVCDIYSGHVEKTMSNLKQLGLANRVKPFLFDSKDLIERSKELGWPKFDFAFIDGDHEGEAPERDFRSVFTMMNPGRRISMHDNTVAWKDVMRAWSEVAAPMLKNHEFCSTIASGTV